MEREAKSLKILTPYLDNRWPGWTEIAKDYESQKAGDIRLPNGETIELKADTYPMKNVFWEIHSNAKAQKIRPGWGITSEATYLLYHYIEHNIAFLFDMKKAREYVNNHSWDAAITKADQHNQTTGWKVKLHGLKIKALIEEVKCS